MNGNNATPSPPDSEGNDVMRNNGDSKIRAAASKPKTQQEKPDAGIAPDASQKVQQAPRAQVDEELQQRLRADNQLILQMLQEQQAQHIRDQRAQQGLPAENDPPARVIDYSPLNHYLQQGLRLCPGSDELLQLQMEAQAQSDRAPQNQQTQADKETQDCQAAEKAHRDARIQQLLYQQLDTAIRMAQESLTALQQDMQTNQTPQSQHAQNTQLAQIVEQEQQRQSIVQDHQDGQIEGLNDEQFNQLIEKAHQSLIAMQQTVINPHLARDDKTASLHQASAANDSHGHPKRTSEAEESGAGPSSPDSAKRSKHGDDRTSSIVNALFMWFRFVVMHLRVPHLLRCSSHLSFPC
ncbi:hypothetical protein B9Z55_023569 [Caenorhabditis nigoni]|uniref:Uncharacterized protein n=1 Tax=Caenorhabditis nigoni TaxID=1611254 RepID=A0A2G5SQG5_9PELO|nr:hypothetical protein B9Z55_023569 [Caenorhabditis nigoni]